MHFLVQALHFLGAIQHGIVVAQNYLLYGAAQPPVGAPHLAFSFLFPLIMGALGAAKHFASDVPMAKKEREVQAATTRYSPWTGMRAPEPSKPNLLGGVIQGGLTGAMLGQGQDNIDAANARADAMLANGAAPGYMDAVREVGANAGGAGIYSPWHFLGGSKY